jgi:prepilin-type N-terminal cleavage/methylation domain-containing protein
VSREPQRAFTVFEVVIVLLIIAVLLAIAIPQVTSPTLTAVSAPDSVVTSGSSGAVAVRVSRRGGASQAGVRVRFESEGKGEVIPAEVATDSTGVATSQWRAGTDSGALRIRVRVAARERPELVLRTKVVAARSSLPTLRPDSAK